MPIYRSADDVYGTMELLFEEVQVRDAKAAEKLQKANVLLRFSLTEPEATITINGRRDPATFSFGDSRIRPEVEVVSTADTFHHVLLGDQKLSKALANRSMKVKGPAYKALAVADLFQQCQELYPEILQQNGVEY